MRSDLNALASKQGFSWILTSQMRLKISWEVGDEKSKGGGGKGEEGRHGAGGGGGEGEGCWSIADEEEGKSLDLSADCLSSSPLLQQLLILCLRRKSASHSS